MDTRGKSISVLTIFIMAALALVFPGLSFAGSLEPSDPPGPTMKTLDQIPPTWSQRLPASERFQGVFEYEDVCYIGGHPYPCTKYHAVLDKETGLVWQQTTNCCVSDWWRAQDYCNSLSLGGRKGWRLPTIQELTSLEDSTQTRPALPSGHPFNVVCPDHYWSATSVVVDNPAPEYVPAWTWYYWDGTVEPSSASWGCRWCVRGGQGVDTQ